MANTRWHGEIGEHYVLYRLMREGFNAAVARINADILDIYAADRKGIPFAVQVKTKTDAEAWRLNEKHENIQDTRLFYAFIDLGKSLEKESPNVFILPSAEVARVCRTEHKAWLNTPPSGSLLK